MRKFLIHLLMLLMLTPGLACGPFMVAGKAHAAASQMPDCPGMGMAQDTGGKKAPDSDVPMLFKDCSHVNLQTADYPPGLKAPDTSANIVVLALVESIQHDRFLPQNLNAIRGPPPDGHSLSQTHHSILLTTQRFRE